MSILVLPSWCPRRPRGWARFGLAAAVAFAALGAGCAEDGPAAPVSAVPDAGPACAPGSIDCVCRGGSSCDDDLLCSAGRCIVTEGTPEPDVPPPLRPPPLRPPSEPVDAGSGPAPSPAPDAGPADDDPDAGVLDAST